jgi:hypothetical protein
MAPDLDGQVLINEGSAVVGEIIPARITEAHPYDLVGGIDKEYGQRKKTSVILSTFYRRFSSNK